MVPYPRIPQQQLLPLDQNGYSTDLYRQGLTPPQLPGDHLHPYGRRAVRRLSRLCIKAARKHSQVMNGRGSERSPGLGLCAEPFSEVW